MSHIVDFTEMDRLRKKLDKEGIEWHDNTVYHRDMILARTQGDGFSVICGDGSFGGYHGLLEVWTVNMDDPEGYLTAEECMDYILDVTK